MKGDQSQLEEEMPRKVVYEAVNPCWEVAVTASNHGFQQASFVNSIATTKVCIHVQCTCTVYTMYMWVLMHIGENERHTMYLYMYVAESKCNYGRHSQGKLKPKYMFLCTCTNGCIHV